MSTAHVPRIVVGVTDSTESRWALAWAVGTARRTGQPLMVVTAIPSASRSEYGLITEQDHRQAARALIVASFAAVCGGTPTDVRIQRLIVFDTPGRALVSAAGCGDLLVIGSSGRWSGPTRRYCARRAPCPLVVVPRPDVADLLGTPINLTRRDTRTREIR